MPESVPCFGVDCKVLLFVVEIGQQLLPPLGLDPLPLACSLLLFWDSRILLLPPFEPLPHQVTDRLHPLVLGPQEARIVAVGRLNNFCSLADDQVETTH